MNWFGFRQPKNRAADNQQEMAAYLATETEENLGRGMTLEEARRAAHLKLGNRTLIREDVYNMSWLALVESFRQDIVYALRNMRKNPAFAVTAILTLALGIGGNTAVFTLIEDVLLKPLHYHQPARLVYFSVGDAHSADQDGLFSSEEFDKLRKNAHSFSALGAYGANLENVTLSGQGDPQPLKGARISADFLEVLGVAPLLGRGFLPKEDTDAGPPVVMISDRLWRDQFGADPEITDKTAVFDAKPYSIAGVLPRGFEFPFPGIDVWFTRPSEWSVLPSRYWHLSLLLGFGRLRPQVSLQQASAELNVLHASYSHIDLGRSPAVFKLVWLKDRLVENVRALLWILFGAVSFVLLIACANMASLLLARATARTREFAIRAALGAAKGRIVRQLLAESLLLSLCGGVGGVLLAKWGLRIIERTNALAFASRSNTLYLPGSRDLHIDTAVLAFTLALAFATSILFGLFPSLHIARPDLIEALRESGPAAGFSARHSRLTVRPRELLVVGQVALSLVLLIGAVLLLQSFFRLQNVDPGFHPNAVLTLRIALPPSRYDNDPKKVTFFRELVDRVQSIPGVRSAAASMSLPTTAWIRTNVLHVEGLPPMDEQHPLMAVIQSVTPGYFHTMGIPLRRGREFTPRENAGGAPPVVIINESLARRLWPSYPNGVNPVGKHLSEAFDKKIGPMQIVGVSADVHEGGLAFGSSPEFYVPNQVHPPQAAYLVVRTRGNPLSYIPAVRRRVRSLDPGQSISDVRTMTAVLESTLGQRRFALVLLGLFAGVAVLLAVVGIYGAIAYSVAQRTSEIGIRKALGARPGEIFAMILRQGLALAAAGVVLGLIAAFALLRILQNLLFGLRATDAATYALVSILFVAIALLASYLPARRAARVEPMSALRA